MELDSNYGTLQIRLATLLEERKMNRNQLSHKAAMSWQQIDNYCTNNITRLDVFALCKLCTVLECEIQDLLKFVPPSK